MTTAAATPTPLLPELTQQLLGINHAAFTARHYAVAYHALMGALPCVQTLADVAGLAEVKRRAEEQLAWIDRHAPAYEHSTPSARKREYISIYHTLALQAGARIRMREHEAPWRALKGNTPNSQR
jgi:hypothetical protein